MSKTELLDKIDALPEILQNQVSDFVEFLFQKHFEADSETVVDLSVEEKVELDKRYSSYQVNPETAMELEALKAKLLGKYGL